MPQKIVLAQGCFDMIHVGHLRHLQEARRMGAILVVGVTKDEFVGKGPGRPVVGEDERLEMVLGLGCVYEAQLCSDSIEALEYFKPTIFCKGYDREITGLIEAEQQYCEKHDIEIRYTKPNHIHTSQIIERIRCASQ